MHRLLDTGLDELTAIVFKMGEAAQQALTLSLRGYIRGRDLSEDVCELSEMLVSMTTEVEEKAFRLIAKYQPVASDLRIINSYIKIAYDFERYGRYAWDISSINKRFGALEKCNKWIQDLVEEMSEEVLQMVGTGLLALKNFNSDLATSVAKSEEKVDKMYYDFLDKLVNEAGITNQCTISSLLVVRYLERIADHTTYICESIVYIVTGKKVTLR